MKRDDRFYAASLTKQLTGAAVALLVKDHRIDPAAPIPAHFLPRWIERPTVLYLLHHIGGLPLETFPESGRWTNRSVIDAISELPPPAAPPGTAYAYSNFGYIILARLVEAAAGMTFRQVVTARLLYPLGISAARIHDDTDPPVSSQVPAAAPCRSCRLDRRWGPLDHCRRLRRLARRPERRSARHCTSCPACVRSSRTARRSATAGASGSGHFAAIICSSTAAAGTAPAPKLFDARRSASASWRWRVWKTKRRCLLWWTCARPPRRRRGRSMSGLRYAALGLAIVLAILAMVWPAAPTSDVRKQRRRALASYGLSLGLGLVIILLAPLGHGGAVAVLRHPGAGGVGHAGAGCGCRAAIPGSSSPIGCCSAGRRPIGD